MRKILVFLCLIAVTILALPAEIDIRMEVPDREAVREAQRAGLMVDNYISRTGELLGVIFEDKLPELYALGYYVEILPETDARVLAMQRREPSGYPLFSTYTSFMENVATDHPVIASLDTFGWSQGGRPLLMMKISTRVAWDEAEPEFCYISTMHGDEPPGTIFLMWFIDSLTDNYGYDSRITRLVDSCEIYIVPLLNPDGYVAMRRSLNSGMDMNRNYPVPDGVDGNDGTFNTDEETDATFDWLKSRNLSYTINFHTGALLTNYPWDHDVVRTTDDSLYKFIAVNYTSRNSPMYYHGGFLYGITNGFDWYEVDGSLQDWTYWTNGDLHLTIELQQIKTPPYNSLDTLWNHNYDAFCAAIEVTLNHGVHGIVTDSVTGDPLAAVVRIVEVEKDIYSDSDNGYYHRILLFGTYNLEFSCPGYYDKSISVLVPDSGLVRADVQLCPMNPIIVYQTDLETDNGGFTIAFFPYYQDWEWGTPSRGIIEPYSGLKVWGTELSGEYHDSSQSRLLLEDIDLPDEDSLTLSFWQWFSFQDISSGEYHDGGNLKLWLSPSDSTVLSPTPDYDHPMSEWNRLIPYQEAFSGLSNRRWWHEVRVDLSAWRGETVDISWDFGSSSVNTQVGWFIDDIAIYYPDTTPLTVVDLHVDLPAKMFIRAYPNPFNSAVRIGVESGELRVENVEIYDITGRIVETIPRNEPYGTSEIIWRPENGLDSGIYFLRIEYKGMNSQTKIIYLK